MIRKLFSWLKGKDERKKRTKPDKQLKSLNGERPRTTAASARSSDQEETNLKIVPEWNKNSVEDSTGNEIPPGNHSSTNLACGHSSCRKEKDAQETKSSLENLAVAFDTMILQARTPRKQSFADKESDYYYKGYPLRKQRTEHNSFMMRKETDDDGFFSSRKQNAYANDAFMRNRRYEKEERSLARRRKYQTRDEMTRKQSSLRRF